MAKSGPRFLQVVSAVATRAAPKKGGVENVVLIGTVAVPAPPANGTFFLKSVNGVLSWSAS